MMEKGNVIVVTLILKSCPKCAFKKNSRKLVLQLYSVLT